MDPLTRQLMMGSLSGLGPIQYIAGAQNQTSSSSLDISKPAGTAQGDLLIFVGYTKGGGGTWTQPAGWTEALDSSGVCVACYTAGASEGATYSATATGAKDWSGFILTFRKAAWDTVGTLSTTQSSNVQTAPEITVASDDSVLLALFACTDGNRSYSSPSSGLVSTLVDSAADGGPSLKLYRNESYSGGASGTKSATASGTPSNPRALLFSIKPA